MQSLGIQERGTIFVEPGDEVYEAWLLAKTHVLMTWMSMLCAKRSLANMRASGSDEA
jgi:predicted membrane GTPase involved in stress response